MCIRYIKKYTGCPHTGIIYDRCDTFLNSPGTKHDITKHLETINGLCRKCGGGPKPEPLITYLDTGSISSWAKESASVEEKETVSTISTDSRVELLRKGSQRAVGGVKRLVGSMRSDRSSGGSSGLPEAGSSEAEWRSLSAVDISGEGCRVQSLQRFIESSLGPIHLSSSTNGSVHGLRPSLGHDFETVSFVTTWTEDFGLASGAKKLDRGREQEDVVVCQNRTEIAQTSWVPVPERVNIEPNDRALYQERVGKAGVVMDQKKLEELARADDRLMRVRGGRGCISCDVI